MIVDLNRGGGGWVGRALWGEGNWNAVFENLERRRVAVIVVDGWTCLLK